MSKKRWIQCGVCLAVLIVSAVILIASCNSSLVLKEIAALVASISAGLLLLFVFYRREGAFDRVISVGIWRQLILLISATLFLLGIVLLMTGITGGGMVMNDSNVDDKKLVSAAYRFFGYNFYREDSSSVSFWFLLASIVGTTFMGGLVVATLSNIIQQRKTDLERGIVVYKGLSNHYVLIGYSKYTIHLVEELFIRHPGCIILIMTAGDTHKVRADLSTVYSLPELKRLFIYSGSMTSEAHLRKLNIPSAKAVYITGDAAAEDDARSIECARMLKICRWNGLGEKPSVLPIHILINKATTYSTIKSLSFPEHFYRLLGQTVTYIRPFSYYENCARSLWGYAGPFSRPKFDTLDFKPIDPESDRFVHLVIVGFQNMGRALLLEALRVCHYPNYKESTGANKTRITVVDPNLDILLPEFTSQYPGLDNISDVDIDYRSCRIEDAQMRKDLEKWALDSRRLLTVAICFNDLDYSFSAALHLPEKLYFRLKGGKESKLETIDNIRILVRQHEMTGAGDILRDSGVSKYRNIKMFGSFSEGLGEDLFDDSMPMLMHAYYGQKYYSENSVNRPSRIVKFFRDNFGMGDRDYWEYLQDCPDAAFSYARQLWYVTDEDFRYANRYQIDMHGTYLRYRAKGVTEDCLMRMEHSRWCAERIIIGYTQFPYTSAEGVVRPSWKKLFSSRKREMKFHNLLIPYSKLSKEAADKDRDVIRNIDHLIAALRIADTHTSDRGFVDKKKYVPSPSKFEDIEIGPQLEALRDRLAFNLHEIWATDKIRDGWAYGPVQSERWKKHPDLVPFSALSEEKKQYDRENSIETIKQLIHLGYSIRRTGGSDSIDETTPAFAQAGRYSPKPIDVSDVVLDDSLLELQEVLAENAHEIWGSIKVREGWKYGPVMDQKRKRHPDLVPYRELPEAEKDYDRKTTMENLKVIIKLGYEIVWD